MVCVYMYVSVCSWLPSCEGLFSFQQIDLQKSKTCEKNLRIEVTGWETMNKQCSCLVHCSWQSGGLLNTYNEPVMIPDPLGYSI